MNKKLYLCSLLAIACSACGDSTNAQQQGPLPKLDGKPAYAVHLAQYGSAAGVALLDAKGALLSAEYISTDSAAPGLNAALSQDIALPTAPCADDRLLILGRGGADYLLEIDPIHGEILGQIAAQDANKDVAYASNPQDVLCFDGGKGLMSRAEPNPAADATALNRGDDLVVVDFDAQKITQRIDLSKFRAQGAISDKNGKQVEETTFARPGSIVPVGKYALVGLARYGYTVGMQVPFNDKGLVLIADLDALSVKSLAMPGLANCGQLYQIADRDDAAIVSCAGAPYGEPSNTGIAIVSVDASGQGKVEHKWQVEDGAQPVYASITSLGGTHMIAVSQDWVNGKGDKAYVVDLATGKSTLAFSAKNAGDLGSGVWSSADKLLLVPDAGVGVRVFQGDAKKLDEQKAIKLDRALPARTVRPLISR